MSNSTRNPYEYINETSIYPELICSICREPYKDPCCTPCDHIFCRECLIRLTQRQSFHCPICRRRSQIASLSSANQLIHQMINHLQVQCTQCGRKDLQRGDIDEHIRSSCSKSIITCPSVHHKCPWIGQRNQVDQHLNYCMSDRLREMSEKFQDERRLLKRNLEESEKEYAKEETKFQSFLANAAEERDTTELTRNFDLQGIENNLEECQKQIQSYREELDSCQQQIKKMRTENNQNRNDIKYTKDTFKQNESDIKHLSTKSQLMQVLLFGNRHVTLENLLSQELSKSSIDLSFRQLIDPDIVIVFQQIIKEQQCKELDLRGNLITKDGISILVDTWEMYPKLEILHLASNSILDAGVHHLVSIFSLINSNLIKLDLDSNAITNVGAKSLAQLLKTNQTLQYLSLRKNRIDDPGMESLAIVLIDDNRTLKELYLNENQVNKNSTIYSFIAMIQNNQSLEIFSLKDCHISEDNRMKLQQIMKYKSNFLLHI